MFLSLDVKKHAFNTQEYDKLEARHLKKEMIIPNKNACFS